jgi:hypothetical protein
MMHSPFVGVDCQCMVFLISEATVHNVSQADKTEMRPIITGDLTFFF